jgi:hypothetical protein
VGKGSLKDLLELDWVNNKGQNSDLGEVLEPLDSKTLYMVSDWLDTDREQLTHDYGHNRWLHLRTQVRLNAWLKQLPPGMSLSPDSHDGLPIQVAAIRTDGKKWNLNIPVRAELLRMVRRYFSERDYAELLGISRRAYRRLRDAIKEEGFTLDRFSPDVLDRIVRGKKRGP